MRGPGNWSLRSHDDDGIIRLFDGGFDQAQGFFRALAVALVPYPAPARLLRFVHYVNGNREREE